MEFQQKPTRNLWHLLFVWISMEFLCVINKIHWKWNKSMEKQTKILKQLTTHWPIKNHCWIPCRFVGFSCTDLCASFRSEIRSLWGGRTSRAFPCPSPWRVQDEIVICAYWLGGHYVDPELFDLGFIRIDAPLVPANNIVANVQLQQWSHDKCTFVVPIFHVVARFFRGAVFVAVNAVLILLLIPRWFLRRRTYV